MRINIVCVRIVLIDGNVLNNIEISIESICKSWLLLDFGVNIIGINIGETLNDMIILFNNDYS